jgi:peptidylprolyl isomerase
MGDAVRIHYECKLGDGSVFASTRERGPKEFVLGGGEVIPGLQQAVVGMTIGEQKTVKIPPAQAYGPYHEELTAWIDRSMPPDDLKIEVGVVIRLKHADGHESDAFVTEISGDKLKVDGNHPLAGKDLHMAIELLDIKTA